VTAAEPQVLEETPDLHGAYPRLGAAQIEALARHGERRPTREGDVLFRQGDVHYDFFAVLAGKVAIVEDDGGHGERLIAVHGPGRFLGELSLLTGEAAFFTAVVREPGEVLAVPAAKLRDLLAQDAALGELVLRACLLRRSLLISLGVGLRIVGSRYSKDTRRLREFAARNRIPHVWVDVEEDQTAETVLCELGVSPDETPVVIWRGTTLRNPSNAELGRLLGLRPEGVEGGEYEVVVVGAGPGGLAAAVYGASEGLRTVALDAVATGGQAATSSRIENYLGFPAGVSGAELAERATIQAEKFGARLDVPAEAKALAERDGHYVVTCDDGSEISGDTVVIATGVRYRRLPVPRLEEFEPHSVYYAATQMEARVCAGDPVAIVGGGNSAGQAALFLSGHAARVHLLVRSADLGEHMSRYLVDRIERSPAIEVHLGVELCELCGDGALAAVVVEHRDTGDRERIDARALFVFIGAHPHTDWLEGQVALDERGYVLTGPAAAHDGHEPLMLETSRPGVFAIGDVRSCSVQRVASAVGEGALAIRLVHEHFARRARSTAVG
jgi:thioredoxin reductase (NADPH)